MPKTFSDDALPIATQKVPSESVEVIDATQTGDVPSGSEENVYVRPPSGYLYELLALHVGIANDPDATSGWHAFQLLCEGAWIAYVIGDSYYDENVRFAGGHWQTADRFQAPSSASAQALMSRGIRASEDSGFRLRYINETDVAQEEDRDYRLSVRKIKVK